MCYACSMPVSSPQPLARPPSTASRRAGRRFWYDFAVFYTGLLWLPASWSPRSVTFGVIAVSVTAAYVAWSLWLGERRYLTARLLLACAAVAPVLGLAWPALQSASEFLMILLMTAAGFASSRVQQRDRAVLNLRIANRRIDVP